MADFVVRIPGRPPSPNRMRHAHWAAASRSSREWRGWAHLAALQAMSVAPKATGRTPLAAALIEPTFVCRTRRRRDDDNLIASLKPVLDGLVDARMLRDDAADVVSWSKPVVELGPADELVLRVSERSERGPA